MLLKNRLRHWLLAAATLAAAPAMANNPVAPSDSATIKQIYDNALTSTKSYEDLRYLTKNIGARLSGSPQAAAAVEWGRQVMNKMGLDRVYVQEVMVPHWVRGDKEIGRVLSGQVGSTDVNIAALGSSVGTGESGLTAEVVEVHNFEELEKLGKKKVKGKIVFFNRAFDNTHVQTMAAYSGAVDQRGGGPVAAAKLGAVAVIVRSMANEIQDVPHTGNTRYQDGVDKIPAAAISTKGAELLSKQLKNDPNLKFYMRMTCENLPEVLSYNVIGELKGTEKPNEIIVVGGHLDSWDLGEGAHDDGTGVVQSMEVLRLFKDLGIKPKRTIRAVLYMNEENGLRGGRKYAEEAKAKGENHIAAIESDAGGFTPRGFGMEATPAQIQKALTWKPLLTPYGLHEIGAGHGGADIGPLKGQGTVALIGFKPDSQRYFDYHHTDIDTFETVNRREMQLGAASMASLVYLISQYGL
ncbi:M20/M25/M40 family metallo-hydrolase [Pontibacter sp. BT310]|uniref:Carboxypeptidase Q n=1 Tax=Pontibacter populi TaxID=890055 RepID=A0ABS6X9M3_9BACT|nr:M20/M25/M40 family metallo-hydrolase [Pontibacter sp. BT310]MBR0569372.1 M20/M25/M40 family metallo-hydrolase [Microvirga sp. STS03]MBW3363801.1 M20/M25/M40 family metallo-hydrolase [Pontibacter populi]